MKPRHSWTSPPTRREVTLTLFALILFVLSYNLESSLSLLGVDSASGAVAARLWAGKSGVLDPDGRRPWPWRDALEADIYGDWKWDEGHVAGDGKERKAGKDSNRYGAMWSGDFVTDAARIRNQMVFGKASVDEAVLPSGDAVPATKIVQHTPGYTILDGAVTINGTIIIVTDDPASVPDLKYIASSTWDPLQPTTNQEWRIMSVQEATDKLGALYGNIEGTSFLSTDQHPSNYTLPALWRAYTALDPSITPTGLTTLPAPRRVIFQSIHHFSDPAPMYLHDMRPRTRAHAGFHPHTKKAAWPLLALMHRQDWADYADMELPFVLERLVVADRYAALRVLEKGAPAAPWEALFARGAQSAHWMEPVRRQLAHYLGLDPDARGKDAVCYVSRQGETGGPRLADADHAALVARLRKMGREEGCAVAVVSERETPWAEMMRTVARCTVMLGVYGAHLADAVYMPPGAHRALVELFPADTFARDNEVLQAALGARYVAFQGTRQYNPPTLPRATVVDYNEALHYAAPRNVEIDIDAVVAAVKTSLGR